MAKKFGSEGSGIVWCHPGGTNCITPKIVNIIENDRKTYFIHPAEADEYYDKDLSDLTNQMNELVASTEASEKAQKKRDAALEIGFLQTSNGYLPVWKRNVSDNERLEDLVDRNSLTPLGSMEPEEVKAYLQIEAENGSDGTWYGYKRSGGTYKCKGAGMGCFVTVASMNRYKDISESNYFPKVAESSPVFDPALRDLANKLNAALNDTQKKHFRAEPTAEITREVGLALDDEGISVVWKVLAHH